jgi:bifunctional UDP-N-acetylglucosamine pyrophosphorylase/glucosamine-1-phosphate N-acetyltransferase
MLTHVLECARQLNPAALYIVYGHGGEQVREQFADADLVWCHQAEQLGTGHAVMQAVPGIPDDHRVLILCGDVPLIGLDSLRGLSEASASQELTVLTAVLDDPSGYGRIVRDGADRIARIVEHGDASPAERKLHEINTGLMAAEAGHLKRWLAALGNDNAQGEYYLTDIVRMACDESLRVVPIQASNAASVLGINDKLQLAEAERIYQRAQADDLMRAGATLADPNRIDVRGSVTVGQDVYIDINAVFTGKVELGDGVWIGPNCVISDTRLGAGCVVHANMVMQGVVAGPHCELGPFARLRPGTELAARVKVGNFVETKNSKVAPGSKINHLSYIGDAELGSDVNVGAGTITCNYDGAAKHLTRIGDGAFIGSGVMLVAPIEIGAGATVGAGSTLTRPAPANQLTLERSKQTTVAGWQRPVKTRK